jgi:hypothetical protein
VLLLNFLPTTVATRYLHREKCKIFNCSRFFRGLLGLIRNFQVSSRYFPGLPCLVGTCRSFPGLHGPFLNFQVPSSTSRTSRSIVGLLPAPFLAGTFRDYPGSFQVLSRTSCAGTFRSFPTFLSNRLHFSLV